MARPPNWLSYGKATPYGDRGSGWLKSKGIAVTVDAGVVLWGSMWFRLLGIMQPLSTWLVPHHIWLAHCILALPFHTSCLVQALNDKGPNRGSGFLPWLQNRNLPISSLASTLIPEWPFHHKHWIKVRLHAVQARNESLDIPSKIHIHEAQVACVWLPRLCVTSSTHSENARLCLATALQHGPLPLPGKSFFPLQSLKPCKCHMERLPGSLTKFYSSIKTYIRCHLPWESFLHLFPSPPLWR